jgi:hypothetical protein
VIRVQKSAQCQIRRDVPVVSEENTAEIIVQKPTNTFQNLAP